MKFTEHTKLRKEKFGTVLFDTLTEKIFISDEIGADILQLIAQGKDLEEISSKLSQECDADKPTIEQDVLEFIDLLKSDNMISECGRACVL